MELVSVIVPIYNVESYLDECLNSIKQQTYSNIEVLLVNDGSTDNSEDIAIKYCEEDSRFSLITIANSGLSAARNKALDKVGGSWIVFVDSDDLLKPNYIKDMLTIAVKNNVSLVAGSYQKFVKLSDIEERSYKSNKVDAKTFFAGLTSMKLPNGIDVSAHSKLYSSSLFKKVRYPEGKLFEDSFVIFRLVELAQSVIIYDNGGYLYRMRDNSIVQKDFNMRRMDYIDAESIMCQSIVSQYPELRFNAEQRMTHVYLNTIGHIMMSSSEKEYRNVAINLKKKVLTHDYTKILFTGELPKTDKIGMILLVFGLSIYKLSYKFFRFLKYRK